MKRSDKTPVYLVVSPTGLFDDEGVELVVVVAAKLTRASADAMVGSNPTLKVEKLFAGKDE